MSERDLFIICKLLYFQFITFVLDTQIHTPPNVRYYPDHQPPLLPFLSVHILFRPSSSGYTANIAETH